MEKDVSNNFSEFLKTHETFQLALIEAVHRYYYDKCFTSGKEGRFKDNDESKIISALHQTLHCANPNWRYRLKKKLERYDAWEDTTALIIDSKPKKFFSIDILANILTLSPQTQTQ